MLLEVTQDSLTHRDLARRDLLARGAAGLLSVYRTEAGSARRDCRADAATSTRDRRAGTRAELDLLVWDLLRLLLLRLTGGVEAEFVMLPATVRADHGQRRGGYGLTASAGCSH